jgi:hypothetical protein
VGEGEGCDRGAIRGGRGRIPGVKYVSSIFHPQRKNYLDQGTFFSNKKVKSHY